MLCVLTWHIQKGASSSRPRAANSDAFIVALVLQRYLRYFPWCIFRLTGNKNRRNQYPFSHSLYRNSWESIWCDCEWSRFVIKKKSVSDTAEQRYVNGKNWEELGKNPLLALFSVYRTVGSFEALDWTRRWIPFWMSAHGLVPTTALHSWWHSV